MPAQPVEHLLTVADLTAPALVDLLDLAAAVRDRRDVGASALAGRSILLHFTKPSTRTRVSFEAATARLGGHAMLAGSDQLQLGRGESISDTAKVISRYCSAIVVRTFAHSEVEEFARHATVPVINALTDRHHPCQALADLMTLRDRFGRLEGLTLAYVGDGNNVAHSLVEACALAGIHVRVGTPAGHRCDAAILARADGAAAATGGSVVELQDPREAVAGAQCVYTDAHVSMGEEDPAGEKLATLRPFRVDEALFGLASPDAVFMHCLPAHRGEEVTPGVIDGPRSVVFDQAENRMHTSAAVLLRLCDGPVAPFSRGAASTSADERREAVAVSGP